MAVKKQDFIAIDFLGKVKETGEIFDITKEEDAKKYNLYNPKSKYGPLTICVGAGHVVEGLDEFLVGKEAGKEYDVAVPAEKAFGKRDTKLFRLVPLSTFNEHKIRPEPGMHINLDNMIATVRSVSGGRVILDFNHPLAGKEVEYQVTIKGIVTNANEKLKALINFLMPGLPYELKENKMHVNTDFPDRIKAMLKEKITKLIPEITDISFKAAEKEGKKGSDEHKKKAKQKPAEKATKV